MNRDNSEDAERNSADSEEDSSFVTKVRSRVSGLFNNSISRLFGTTPERRKNEEENHESQPPSKKPKRTQDFPLFNNDNVNHSNNSLNFLTTTNNYNNEPGPSGIRPPQNFYKLPNPDSNILNGDKDSDSGESTSGYSSMARINQEISRQQLQHVEHKNSNNNNNISKRKEITMNRPKKIFNVSTPETPSRSLFGAESLSPQGKNTSLSSRRPSFNSSNFSSPNFVDRTLTTSRIINSPFYNGPTIYGGASAYDKRQESRRQQLKNSIQIQPVNRNSSSSNPCTSLSKTARRILDTLEQYSSTLSSDVKKIPPPTKVDRKEGAFTRYVGANPYIIRKGSSKELQVPTVPELLRMKEKIKIQEATDKIRKIATSKQNDDEYKTSEKIQQKHTNKIKTKITSVRKTTPSQSVEIIQDVALTPVPLTLPENKLPKFDMVIPPPSSCISKTATLTDNEKKPEFKFSKPLVISSSGNFKSIVAINNFKFSEPVSKKLCKKLETITKNDAPLMEKFKPAEGTWECNTCLIRNKSEAKKCVACETPRDKPENKEPTTNFLMKFTKKSDEWDCDSCLVRNKMSCDKCVACGTSKIKPPAVKTQNSLESFKKSSDEWECRTCLVRNKKDATKCIACESANPNDLSKFKPDPETWQCETCLIRNKNSLNTCAACQTPKEKVFTVVKSTEKWECPTCMVRNDNSAVKCPCCETAKPGGVTLVNKNTVNMFNFGVNKTQFNFGIKSDETNGTVKDEQKSVLPFKFGNTATPEIIPDVKFGLTASTTSSQSVLSGETTTPSKNSVTDTLCENKITTTPSVSFEKTATTTTPSFTFGSQPSKETEEKSATLPSFAFKPPVEKASEKNVVPAVPLLFGDIKTTTMTSSSNSSTSSTNSSMFTFGKQNAEASKPMFSFGQPPANTGNDTFKFGDSKSTAAAAATTTPSLNFAAPLKNNEVSAKLATNDSLKNGGFNFGNTVTNNNNQAAVFSFGATSQSSGGGGGFNFSAPAPSSAAGFKFSAPAPAFDANIKPTFNFTGGSIPTFSAAPAEGGSGGMPTRKIKRGVRRVTPR